MSMQDSTVDKHRTENLSADFTTHLRKLFKEHKAFRDDARFENDRVSDSIDLLAGGEGTMMKALDLLCEQ